MKRVQRKRGTEEETKRRREGQKKSVDRKSGERREVKDRRREDKKRERRKKFSEKKLKNFFFLSCDSIRSVINNKRETCP
jgi:hypothetical protein